MHKHVRFLCSGYLTRRAKQGMASGGLRLDASRKTSPSYCQQLQLQKYFPACRDDGKHPRTPGTPSPRSPPWPQGEGSSPEPRTQGSPPRSASACP